MANNPDRSTPNIWAKILSAISVIGIISVLIALLTNLVGISPLQLWGLLALLITLLLIGLGIGANGKWYGVLIDNRNRTSLSRLQISLWTILAISAFLSISLVRSMPGALSKASADAITQCRETYIKVTEKIDDLETLRGQDPAAAKATEDRAAIECVPDPLNIKLPEELLLALGISTVSFAGSSLILSNKRNKPEQGLIDDLEKKISEQEKLISEAETEIEQINNELGPLKMAVPITNLIQQKIDTETKKLNEKTEKNSKAKTNLESLKERRRTIRQGLLLVNAKPQNATLADMFEYDEDVDSNLVDLSKVQMFFFTVAILVSYSVALAGIMANRTALMHPFGVDFPSFSSTLNALLAISHAGYLTVNSIDHTKTT